MAKIRTLSLNGFKGQKAVEQLTGLDIFVGPNGAGKSARLEGLAMAQLGYVPGQSRKAEDIMKSSAGDEMSVGLMLDNGFGFLRTFTRKRKLDSKTGLQSFSIKESISLTPSRGESTDTQRKARIVQEMGSFSIHLDFSEFEALSPAKKREYLYGFVSGAGDQWSKDTVRSRLIERIATEELKSNNPDSYSAALDMIEKALGVWVDGLSVEDGVLAMLEWAKEQQSYWNAKKNDAQGAVRQLAELKNQLTQTDRDIASKKQELDDLIQQLIEVEKELSKGLELKEAFESRKSRIAELEDEIARLQVVAGPPDTSDIDAKIDELKQQIVELDYDLSGIESEITSLQSTCETLMTELDIIRQKRTKIEAELNTLQTAKDRASSNGGLCVISKLVACPKDFTRFLEYIDKQIEDLSALLNGAKAEEAKIVDKLNETKAAIKALQDSRSSKLEVAAKQREINKELETKIAGLVILKDELSKEAEKNTSRLEMVSAELERLQSTPVKPVPEMAMLEQQKEGLEKAISELKSVIEEKQKAQATLLNMKASMIDSKDAEYKFYAAKSLMQELGPNGIQGELLKSGLEPLRDVIQDNLRALDIPHEFTFKTESDRGNETFDFGWIDNSGTFVSFDTLSGGQRMLVLTALLVALLQKGDATVRIITIDEIQTLDDENRTALLNGLFKMYAEGKLDNAILAGLKVTKKQSEGWTVHELGVDADEEAKTA